MSNSTHKKKQSSSRHNAQRLEAGSKSTSLAEKRGGRIGKKTISRARLADMTAELDGQFAQTVYSSAQLPEREHKQDPPRTLVDPSEVSMKTLAEVLGAL